MRSFDHEHVQSIISFRANAVQAVAITLGLALGINLLATGLVLQTRWSGIGVTLAGLLLTLVVSALVAVRSTPKFKRSLTMDGVFVVKGVEQLVLPVSRYQFAERVEDYVLALSKENKALGKAWSDTPLSGMDLPKPPSPAKELDAPKEGRPEIRIIRMEVDRKDTPSARLAREVAEYFVLDRLSTHLRDYFDARLDSSDTKVVVLNRRDIPKVLLDNRFLELFSRPIEEREAFSSALQKDSEGEVYTIYSEAGAIYDRFDLVLPRGTTVDRHEDGAIEIKTKRFSLRIAIDFEGWSASLPRDFEILYLGQQGFHGLNAYKIGLNIDIKFTARSFLTRSGWEYFQWLDSFLIKLKRDFSFTDFLDAIGWEHGHTNALIDRNLQRYRASRKESSAASASGSEERSNEPKKDD